MLLRTHRAIARAIAEGRAITPAAEWLLDNYHVVEAQIRQINDDLPPGYYRQLPKLASGFLAGYPRVFGLAWAFVAHTDSRFDAALLCRFVRAYQEVQPLTIGELWAVAITLRIVLVENLRRAAERIASARDDRQRADDLADQLIAAEMPTPSEPVSALLREWDGVDLSMSFVVQLLHRLRDQGPRVAPAMTWLEQRLNAAGTSSDAIVRDEHQRQGASNVTVRNIITSMRAVSAVDWADLFENVSLVDEILRGATPFGSLDFSTRDQYRRAIEVLARNASQSELWIAKRAAVAASKGRDERERDPGYWLIGPGRSDFADSLPAKKRWRDWTERLSATAAIRGYIAAVGVVAGVLVAIPWAASDSLNTSVALVALLSALALIPALDAAVALVNTSVLRRFSTNALPGLELADGIPASLRTLVVIPTLLTSHESIAEQVQRLETHHLASLHGDLCFALLTDGVDALTATLPEDDALLDAALVGIAVLNRRYGQAPGGERFLLLNRRRVWNEAQQRWMGWERKRGKLHELNRLLRGATDTTYAGMDGLTPAVPTDVRFVITLDADTRLPRDAVRRLVGKMAHPLNRPRIDVEACRVVEGHAVLQPRIVPSLPSRRDGSLFQRLFSSASGIDPYAAAVSDVYQDLSGEGSYVGKGIYDVDAFEAVLANRVPENALLSHDLFEGMFARAGLVSDVELVEEFPTRYDVAASRAHRWARGDWQLLPWLFGRGSIGAAKARNAIPLMGHWKMFDNLRRTLHAPASLLTLIMGWTLPGTAPLIWTAFVLGCLAMPTLPPVLAAIIPHRTGVSKRSHVRALFSDAWLAIVQTSLVLAFIAHQTGSMIDAIVRTIYRMTVSHRNLLEWVTAAEAQGRPRLDLPNFYRRMSFSLLVGVTAIALGMAGICAWQFAMPFGIAWLAAPLLAWWISRSPSATGRLTLSDDETITLRLIARRAWSYFDTFVTAADNHLPPDNFQEDPRPVLAHRTSPTNIGLYLLSIVTARDLGWIGTHDAVRRLRATLATLHKLERFRGHVYNWYDTQDLRALEPKYVSSVDSGNLAAHLITLSNACTAVDARAISAKQVLLGIQDGLDLLTRASSGTRVQECAAALRVLLPSADEEVRSMQVVLQSLAVRARTAIAHADELYALQADDRHAAIVAAARELLVTIAGHQVDLGAQTLTAQADLESDLLVVAADARALAYEMRFDFLFDPERKLLSIGYRVIDGSLDPSCYDLLASEARLASFFAIANGDLPARHWFRLGRGVTPVRRGAALVSWSGSMFEYLMPSLVMRAPTGSLLEQTSRLIVQRQISYGAEHGVPWGISESAYNARDLEFTYQYSSFGVPGLGLKRGLGESIVIAPYATALAAMVDPHAAVENFAHLTAIAPEGRYGFPEALDFTPRRLPAGQSVAVVRAYMAHHQGMTIVSIANTLLGGVMRARFHAEPSIQATELLLQERTPRDVAVAHVRAEETEANARPYDVLPVISGIIRTPHDATPRTRLLSNGNYAVMLTASGSGYSRWQDFAVTRWREDPTCDHDGSHIFVRDIDEDELWSAGFQPTRKVSDSYRAVFAEDRAEISRHDAAVSTTLEVIVSPESDAEVRRVSISNSGDTTLEIDVTSYAELVLAPTASDRSHPAFSKLFVQTEYLPDTETLLATRRRRSPEEPEVWAAHQMVIEGQAIGAAQYETDRAKFIGRGRGLANAAALRTGALSCTSGTVLDPIFSLRSRLRVAPGATAHVSFWTLVAPSRTEVLDLADKHHDAAAFERAVTLAWTQAQVQLHHLGITPNEANLFQRLAGHVLYSDPTLRPNSDALSRAQGGQAALWPCGVSGDLPIVLVRIDDADDLDIVRQLIRAFDYWRLKQLEVDVVILNERAPSYTQDLQIALETLTRTRPSPPADFRTAAKGQVFVLRSDLIPADSRIMLLAAARAVLLSRRGSLAEQLERIEKTALVPAAAPSTPIVVQRVLETAAVDTSSLEFFNGLGGFADDGNEYVTVLRDGRTTPAPWLNVVANPSFGFQVSSEGSGYTWAGNSRDNQLTPWSNDPVCDAAGEILYVRDDDTGALWGPTALPIRHPSATYVARHGQGYSRFEHTQQGIALELLQFVPLDSPIKISRLTIRNTSGRTRRLTVTGYVEWVLGATRGSAVGLIATQIDESTGALLATNLWSSPTSGVAFLDLDGRQTSWTGDRREFIGRNGALTQPAALDRTTPLSGRVGTDIDACGAMQTSVELEEDASIEIVMFLGQAKTAEEVRSLVTRWRATDLQAALVAVRTHWNDVLGAVTVKTPDRAFDILQNRWLLYQTLACRIWARSAFYQSSGAYGFRDQLQDTMAMLHTRPEITRTHLLRAAGRQFIEGDVQHWWLPESGRGVRTRVSDDRSWLAYCAAHYVEVTGDTAVLDESVPFLDGPPLREGEGDEFFLPSKADHSASLFEHCALALEASLDFGSHGLPKIGTGDWNDGMSRVGVEGRGESVWLAWFLHTALERFAPLAEQRGDALRAARWRGAASQLRVNIEHHAWDGAWYLRGFFDDGSPLGSSANDECRIDSIAQSWGVISGAAPHARSVPAMAAVFEKLVDRDGDVVRLFAPPFNRSNPDPGYIQGYPPGIRENGGQYTHAALWSVMAYARLGDAKRANELFSMLNPIRHSLTPAHAERYKVEPYVVAADIYGVAPHQGRGGWTWYTGSAAWMYRVGLESVLGCRVQGDNMVLTPSLPPDWPGFELRLRYRKSVYHVDVRNESASANASRSFVALELDGFSLPLTPAMVPLVDDGATHYVRATVG